MTSPQVIYDAVADAAQRWPEWRLMVKDLAGVGEIVCPTQKVIMIDSEASTDCREYALAHALAHLDLGHHESDHAYFTADDEAMANTLADIRMDRRLHG